MTAFELDAYLARIGLTGHPDLAEVHRAQVTSIPFENLDPRGGVPVSLELDDLQRKLVDRRRGGYCFELNMLLAAALEALGARVDLHLARVRYGAGDGVQRPRSHLVLGVRDEGRTWLADAGFGRGTPLEPLPLAAGSEVVQSGWCFRLVADGAELVLQTVEGGEWVDVYGFVPVPVTRVDLEPPNWWTSTHPRSPFVTGLIVASQRDATRTSLSDWGDGLSLTQQTPPGPRTVAAVSPEQVPTLLAAHFDLPGFELDADGHLVPPPSG